jgi:hypothetical protein
MSTEKLLFCPTINDLTHGPYPTISQRTNNAWRLRISSPEHSEPELSRPKQAEKIAKFDDNSDTATLQLLESFIQETQETERRVNLQVIATKRNLTNIAKHPDGPGRGVLARPVRDLEGKAPYSDFDYRRQSIVAELYGSLPKPWTDTGQRI